MADAILCVSGIYAIRNKLDGKKYIGSSSNVSDRWKSHRHKLRRGAHHSPKLQAAWSKYGAEAFVFEVLEVVPDLDQLLIREQAHIDGAQVVGKAGYNILSKAGSLRGYRHTDESKAKISAKLRGVKRPGAGEFFRGRKLSAEHVAKVVEKHKGSKRSEQARANISAAMKGKQNWLGRKHSQETKDKISAKAKARPAKKGWKHSPEMIEKFLESHAYRRVSVIFDGVQYASYQDAATALGYHKSRIGQLVKEGKARRLA